MLSVCLVWAESSHQDYQVILWCLEVHWHNGTSSHTHEILNFRPFGQGEQQQQSILVQPEDNGISLRGVLDLGANRRIAWNGVQSNKTGNDEVIFKASTDSGKTFGDKMNLSNTPNSESQDAKIAAAGNNVYVSWWERNATSNE